MHGSINACGVWTLKNNEIITFLWMEDVLFPLTSTVLMISVPSNGTQKADGGENRHHSLKSVHLTAFGPERPVSFRVQKKHKCTQIFEYIYIWKYREREKYIWHPEKVVEIFIIYNYFLIVFCANWFSNFQKQMKLWVLNSCCGLTQSYLR